MAECDECVLGYGYWHEIPTWHLTPDGYAIPCQRGPIERELRALTTYAVAVDNHSRAAASIIVGAATDMLHRGHDAIDNGVAFDDYMSEAIEAAAALGL